MVTIRLARQGKKNDPFYRVVVVEKSRKVTGKPLAVVGFWHPRTGEKKMEKTQINEWVKKGAQISPAVSKLLN